jgi:hypothetical protein
MKRTMRIAVMVAAIAALAGCSAERPVYDGKVASHSIDDYGDAPRPQYANQIPVYPGAEIEDAMGSESWGDTPESHSYGMTWWFKGSATQEQLVAFYDFALAGAKREVDDEGAVHWTLAPQASEPGEEIGVIVEQDGFRIREETKRKGRSS